MAEILMDELMYNIGDLEVSRSAVNPATGGYTWTITFLRDRGSLPMAGQHGYMTASKGLRVQPVTHLVMYQS